MRSRSAQVEYAVNEEANWPLSVGLVVVGVVLLNWPLIRASLMRWWRNRTIRR